MALDKGFEAVALALQEADDSLTASDICSRLRDALRDLQDDGEYNYYVDHIGDGESGDVIYSCNGDLMKAPYEFSVVNGKQVVAIDTDAAVDVMPRTSYEEEADEEDHYASMEEAFKTGNIYTGLPLYERFISKAERNSASDGSFAGKGKSFPILKPGDVMAAVRSMGRAGSGNYDTGTLKRNIIRIAKKKGWTKYLPKAWRGDSDSNESHRSVPRETGTLALVEAASTLETIVLREARADYEIKLIAPGKGSSAFYPAEVLKRDGPKVFTAGTHVYLNHPTAAEEAARPEGDVANLAGVLTTSATYHESHAKGPGLYARMKVFADHAQMVEEKAPHVGMSIRASGAAESGKQKDGLPVLKELTAAESVDVVTRAGAGGMILTEAARAAGEVNEVTLQEAQKMIAEATAPLLKRALQADAREEAERLLENVPKKARQFIIEEAMREIPEKDGALDLDKFREAVVAAHKRVASLLSEATGGARVVGLGPSEPSSKKDLKEAKRAAKAERKEDEQYRESRVQTMIRMGMPKEAAEAAARRAEEAA